MCLGRLSNTFEELLRLALGLLKPSVFSVLNVYVIWLTDVPT